MEIERMWIRLTSVVVCWFARVKMLLVQSVLSENRNIFAENGSTVLKSTSSSEPRADCVMKN